MSFVFNEGIIVLYGDNMSYFLMLYLFDVCVCNQNIRWVIYDENNFQSHVLELLLLLPLSVTYLTIDP